MHLFKSTPLIWLQSSLLLLVLILSLPTQAATMLQPVDNASKDPSFLAFRSQLLKTIERKDAKAFLAVVNKNIHVSFGMENGIEDFKKMWGLNKPATSQLWAELSKVLKMGGSFSNKTTFVAPYVFSEWPEDKDAFENWVVIAKDVNIRAKPSTNAAVLKKVSYEILPVEFSENEQWVTVKLDNGKQGYIASQYIRSSVDYRAFFEKINGRWQMTVFIAGD
ncbi:MAG: SH3 domain-containing protein [Thiolinea sp.]